jgi:GT2 family glycosyltransferase
MDAQHAHRVGVVIPFYRHRDRLERCLEHLRAQTASGIEIFVRDNSHDNIYFTAAVNEGLRRFCWEQRLPYVVVLNQDAYLDPTAIEALVDFLDRTPECGIACPVQVNDRGEPSWAGSLRAWPTGQHRLDPAPPEGKPLETYWANGAAQMIRTAVVQEVGLWDRNLRFLFSDSDFSFRARACGWKIHVVPAARCEHALSGSAADSNPTLELVKVEDGIHFARKWLSGDLYRSLACEGPTMLRLAVTRELDMLERMAAEWRRQLKLSP